MVRDPSIVSPALTGVFIAQRSLWQLIWPWHQPIAGTYLLQGPFGPNKTNLPTYLGGASQSQQTPYPGRSRNPGVGRRELSAVCYSRSHSQLLGVNRVRTPSIAPSKLKVRSSALEIPREFTRSRLGLPTGGRLGLNLVRCEVFMYCIFSAL